MNSTVKPENDIAGTATQRPLLSRDFVLLVDKASRCSAM